MSIVYVYGGDAPDRPLDAVWLRLGSDAASVYAFEVTPDAEGCQIRGFVAAASRTKLEVVRGDVVPIADGARTLVTIALVDVFVLVIVLARDHWAPHRQEVFTQATEQPAAWMLASERPSDIAVQEQCRLMDPHAKPYPPDAETVADDVSMTQTARVDGLGRAHAWSAGARGLSRFLGVFWHGCLA